MTDVVATHSGDGGHLKESAVAVKEAVVDLAGEVGRYARQRVGAAKDSTAAVIDTVKTKAKVYNDGVVSFIRRNPYKSLAIAAGVGLAVGFMLRRRR